MAFTRGRMPRHCRLPMTSGRGSRTSERLQIGPPRPRSTGSCSWLGRVGQRVGRLGTRPFRNADTSSDARQSFSFPSGSASLMASTNTDGVNGWLSGPADAVRWRDHASPDRYGRSRRCHSDSLAFDYPIIRAFESWATRGTCDFNQFQLHVLIVGLHKVYAKRK
jgi:hypothetical protein